MKQKAAAQFLLLTALGLIPAAVTGADAPINSLPAEPFDYATPALVTGTVYETGSNHKKVLFTFERSATRTGPTVRVERRFKLPDGSTAAMENIVYQSGQLVSLEMKELQAGLWGGLQVKPDPKKPARLKLTINYGHDGTPEKGGSTEDLPKDTLVDDSIYPFILMHWDELNKDTSVKFHFVSLEWEKTFAFKLAKTGEGTVDQKKVVFIRMEPANLFLSQFMNPVNFSIEKEGLHRVLEYTGRTTPRIKSGKNWKYLDAETVFDWDTAGTRPK